MNIHKSTAKVTCDKCDKEIKESAWFHVRDTWGFGSKYDEETWEFYLCEDCLEEIVKIHKIKVRKF